MFRYSNLFVSLIFLILTISCSKSLEITTINGFPKEIDGCSCYFSKNENDFQQKKFIYLDTYYAGTAFISLNGKMIKIDLENPNANDYIVEIEFLSDEKTNPETWWKTGILRVMSQSGETVESEFVGECGC